MRRTLTALCLFGASGCAAAPHAGPAARVAEPAPREVEKAAPAAQAIVPPRPLVHRSVEIVPAAAPPLERACTLSSTGWSGQVQVGPGEAVYGTVTAGPVTLSLGSETRDGSAFVEAGQGPVELVGTIDAPLIFSEVPITLASFVTPHAWTALGWQPTDVVGRVGVTLDISDVFAVPSAVDKQVDCRALTLDKPSFDAARLVANGGPQSAGVIGGGVDLFLRVGLPPIARTGEQTAESVSVLERRGRHTRVAIRTERFVAVGWVASDAISNYEMGGMGSASGLGLRRVIGRTRTCRHDLELIAEVAGSRHVVGRLRTGGKYVPASLDVAEGFTRVTLDADWFQVAEGAKLLVRTHDLAGC